MKRKAFAISALAVSAALIAGAALAQQGLNIAIATGGTGGVYYPLGGGMANVLTKYVPGAAATARVTGGSVDNLKLIGSGQSEIGFSMADAAVDALKGEDKFKGNPVNLRTLTGLFLNLSAPLSASTAASTITSATSVCFEPISLRLSTEPPVTRAVAAAPGTYLVSTFAMPPPSG